MNPTPAPIDVTLNWKEVRSDRTTVARSHHQRITEFPFKYIVNVGGSDHPIMESLTLNVEGSGTGSPYGYSDGTDVGGQKYLYTKQTIGTNWAKGMPYSLSRAPSGFQSSALGQQHHDPHRRRCRIPGNRQLLLLAGTVLGVRVERGSAR